MLIEGATLKEKPLEVRIHCITIGYHSSACTHCNIHFMPCMFNLCVHVSILHSNKFSSTGMKLIAAGLHSVYRTDHSRIPTYFALLVHL